MALQMTERPRRRWRPGTLEFKCHDFYGETFLILRNIALSVSAFLWWRSLCQYRFHSIACHCVDSTWPFRSYYRSFFCVRLLVEWLFFYFRLWLWSDLFGSFLFVNIQFHLVWLGFWQPLTKGTPHTCIRHIYNVVNCNHCHYHVATHWKNALRSMRFFSSACFIGQFSLWSVFQ